MRKKYWADATEKQCPKCKRTQPIICFAKSKVKTDGRSVYCKVCMKLYKYPRNTGVTVSYKKCPGCDKTKAARFFYPDKELKSGLGECKLCVSKRTEKYRAKNKYVIACNKRHAYILNLEAEREKSRQRHKQEVKERAEYYKERHLKYRRSHPLIHKANRKWKEHKKKNNISTKPCVVCGKLPAIAHHNDYAKPLSIMWLCHAHHRAWHRVFLAKHTK